MAHFVEDFHRARLAAVKEALKFLNGRRVIGLGTGSTAELLIKEAHATGLLDGKELVASSMETVEILSRLGYKVFDTLSVDSLELYLDSADEVDGQGRMVKGGGAALTMEKLLARHAELRVFVVDEFKVVDRLGVRRPIPIEVVPGSLRMVLKDLARLGLMVSVRKGTGKRGPVVSDVGGIILDSFPPPDMSLEGFERLVKGLTGVIETGLFLSEADVVIVGFNNGSVRYLKGLPPN
ncbi:MAG: ribose 5-phosphate isomerase A [Zestosphaera sp.]